ncbi:L-amino acid amidase [Grifola frondosa]|uniref:L-amino acid amidase n=1 Tax=Grifola frondosa TaxID=5627 RepID=A0A1C7MID6_GRIFR|nr:L-amino acid amidase [Grifola frondosa]
MMTPTSEGFVDFNVPAAGKACKTWYKIFGDLKSGTPLVGLHGGPGSTHHYILSLVDLAASHSISVVLYDQLGNGNSTHLPEKRGDTAFWTEQLFLDELDNLLSALGIRDNYALLGHSWGGMLGARHAARQPTGLRRLVISDSPADMKLWLEAANKLLAELPRETQDTLMKHETAGTTDSQEYKEAIGVFYARYLCRVHPMPSEVSATFEWMEKDPTVYLTMNGPSEFHVIGSLKDWSILDEIHKINVPTLLLNGAYDEAQDSTVVPFFKSIPQVKCGESLKCHKILASPPYHDR